MDANQSKMMYERLVDKLKSAYSEERIKDGQFGALMEVAIVNDGPVTVTLESPSK